MAINNADLSGAQELVGYVVQTTELTRTISDVNKSDGDKFFAMVPYGLSCVTGMNMRSENKQQVLRALPPEQQTFLLSGPISLVQKTGWKGSRTANAEYFGEHFTGCDCCCTVIMGSNKKYSTLVEGRNLW